MRQQVIDKYGARTALEGGLKVQTTLDLSLQRAADDAVKRYLGDPPHGPQAALVAIDNDSGEIRAMVGGTDYSEKPFNLATQGQRQPGSAFKPFVLATAIRRGISPSSTWTSKRMVFDVPNSIEKFTVNNYDSNYSGVSTLARATTFSDNSVFAQVGIKTGTKRIARTAERMGIRTPVSSNYAITLGGLRRGVTPLDLAHAYETFATGGVLVSGSLGARKRGPVGIRKVTVRDTGRLRHRNTRRLRRVLPKGVAETTVEHPAHGHQRRHGQARRHPRRAGMGQDRDDRELRRRVVRRRDAEAHGRRLGRLSGRPEADDERVQRRAGRGRHVPGADLARLPRRLDRDREEAPRARLRGRQGEARRKGREGRRGAGDDGETATVDDGDDAAPPLPASCIRAGEKPEPDPAAGATTPDTTTTPADPDATGDAPADGDDDGAAGPDDGTEAPVTPPATEPTRAAGRADAGTRARPATRGRARLRRRRAVRRRPAARSALAPARAPSATAGAADASTAAAMRPGGHGRETLRLPATQKRHGSSTARVIPIRVLTTTTGSGRPAGGGPSSIGPPSSAVSLRSSQIPSACVSLPGPEHRSVTRSRPRRSRIASRPVSGSSARISTAAPTPSGSTTAFSSAWTPYER